MIDDTVHVNGHVDLLPPHPVVTVTAYRKQFLEAFQFREMGIQSRCLIIVHAVSACSLAANQRVFFGCVRAIFDPAHHPYVKRCYARVHSDVDGKCRTLVDHRV